MSRKHKIYKPSQSYKALEDIADSVVDKVPDEVLQTNFTENNLTENRRPLVLRTQPIAIGIPMDEVMYSVFLSNFLYLSIMPWDNIITTTNTFVSDARNSIHNTFLEKSTATHLFMIDSDVLPPPYTIERLLKHDLPVVGGFYRKKEKFKIKSVVDGSVSTIQRPVVYDYNEFNEKTQKHTFKCRSKEGTGLESVDGMGAGCWMIRRDVCEAIGKDPFSLDFGGEDLCFCLAIKKAGFPIFVDWEIGCGHAGVQWV